MMTPPSPDALRFVLHVTRVRDSCPAAYEKFLNP